MKSIQKIAIIGGPGTGKTTLGKKLSNNYHLPLFCIDEMKFTKDWKRRSKKEIHHQILSVIEKNSWIIEGNTLINLDKIVKKADLTIFLDFTLDLQLQGILKRFIFNFFNNKVKDRISLPFFCKTLLYNIQKKPKIIKMLKTWGQKIITFHTPSEIVSWLQKGTLL